MDSIKSTKPRSSVLLPLLEEWTRVMVLLLKGWLQEEVGGILYFWEVECLQEPQTPLGNTNVVESRIFSPYHALGGLERAGDGRVSKD